MPDVLIGDISDFFSRPVVAAVQLTQTLALGDTVKIKGHTTDLEFRIDSMQIDGKAVSQAESGASVGIKVPDRVRKGDVVYKVTQ